ncbi:Stress-responsive transcriptional regulator [Methanosarcina sp. MTP4]|uniref:PspC domain-containing protein n=1 Tax=Methanosarcina sp. MTP4 TaxID=1434100 RepID=UPI0006154E8D|nr:PspC domain-containing protein [Methanosarcina sp. MTP4]AKB23760.1 Stress-responsive transcriptional regulator [Methanosarcina sp. MTP4]
MQENPNPIEKKDVEADTSEAAPEPEEGAGKKAEKEVEVKAEVETAKEEAEEAKEEAAEEEKVIEEKLPEEEIVVVEAAEEAKEAAEEAAEEAKETAGEAEERVEGAEETKEERASYTMKRTLTKSKSNKMIFGVCGGIGEYFGIDPTLIRLAFVLLAFLNGIGIVIYIILAVIMPSESGVEMGKE